MLADAMRRVAPPFSTRLTVWATYPVVPGTLHLSRERLSAHRSGRGMVAVPLTQRRELVSACPAQVADQPWEGLRWTVGR